MIVSLYLCNEYVIKDCRSGSAAARRTDEAAIELRGMLTCRIAMMREGAFVINVSRGGLLDTEAAIDALERGQIGCLCAHTAPWLAPSPCTDCHLFKANCIMSERHDQDLRFPAKSTVGRQGHGRV